MNDATGRPLIFSVNGGSSSLKCTLFAGGGGRPEPVLNVIVRNIFSNPEYRFTDNGNSAVAEGRLPLSDDSDRHFACLRFVLDWIDGQEGFGTIDAVGHRVVHGGDIGASPLPVTPELLVDLHALCALAPLHQPVNLALIACCNSMLPGVPQVACFDTAFHHDQPSVARLYALPRSLRRAAVRGYGFHGISYEYVWSRLRALDDDAPEQAVIVAHLGAGASMCAIGRGRSVATTMGFSTADGLPMATRCGSVDPGVFIYLMREHGMTADELETLIYKQSGLLAVSGLSGDMQTLQASRSDGARKAIEYFSYRAVREIGSLVAALGGLDTLVFTGGIGENDAHIRRSIVQALGWLGANLDTAANAAGEPVISTQSSSIVVRVIPTDEAAMIAAHTARVLNL